MYRPPLRLSMQQVRRDVPTWPVGSVYVGSDDSGHWFMDQRRPEGLGDIGDMFKRLFKITPKSFTYGNITRSLYNITPAHLLLQAVAPKIDREIGKKVAPIAIGVMAAGTLAYVAGPSIMSMLGPKLSSAGSLLGKGVEAIGGVLGNVLGKMNQPAMAQVAQEITPQQIAQVEQAGYLTPDVAALIARAQANAQQVIPTSMYGAADAYPNSGLPAPVQAGMGSENIMLMIGAGTLVALAFGSKK